MKDKFSSTVAGAAIFLTIVGVLAKGLGFIREIIFASFFGLSAEFDMYLVGAVLPVTIGTVIIYLGQNYLIPAANNIRTKNIKLMENFLQMNFNLFILGGILLAGLLYLSSEWIISMYLHMADPETIATTILIFRLYLVTVPLSCAVSVLSAYNQINYEFKYPAYSNLLLSVSYILLVILFADQLNIYIIPIGFIAGSVIQVIYLMKKTKFTVKIIKINLNEFKGYLPSTLIIIILIESIGQLYLLADRYFWNYVPEGGLAALNYAQTLFLLPILILSIALSTAIFPRLSEMISRNLINELENTFNQSIRINIAIFLPITFFLMYYGTDLISILFERGKFSRSDTIITHEALKYYSLSLIFYSIYSVANKMVYGMGLIKELLYITIIGILLKIGLNFLLVSAMEQNGLALSTSLSFVFFTVSALYLIYKKISFTEKYAYLKEIYFQGLNLFTAFAVSKLLISLVPGSSYTFIMEIMLFSSLLILNIVFLRHSVWNSFIIIAHSFQHKKNIFGTKNG